MDINGEKTLKTPKLRYKKQLVFGTPFALISTHEVVDRRFSI